MAILPVVPVVNAIGLTIYWEPNTACDEADIDYNANAKSGGKCR